MKSKNYTKLKKAYANDPEMLRVIAAEEQSDLMRKMVENKPQLSPIQTAQMLMKGDQGEKGDMPSEEDLLKVIKPLIPDFDTILQIIKPVKGEDYFDGDPGEKGEKGDPGRDGKDADNKKIVSELYRLLPKAEEIASKVKVQTVDKQEITNKIISYLEKKQLTVADVIKELKKNQHLEPKNIKGLPINMNDMRWHGGGLSTVAHDDTLTGTGTASSPLSVVGGGALTFLDATGTVDDSNTQFSFTEEPGAIVMNGSTYREGSTVGGTVVWTWDAGTLTATMFAPVGTGGDIYGIK